MYLDKENLYSEAQAITATAVSTNVIDHTIAKIGPGTPIRLVASVVEAFDAGTVAISLQTATDAAFTTPVVLTTTAAMAAATMVAGYKFSLSPLPEGMLQFSRLNYTVTGTPTTGQVTAGLVIDEESI